MGQRAWLAPIVGLAALSAAACEQDSGERVADGNAEVANEAQPVDTNMGPADLPPMIEESASYRCTDGNALYVDLLTDDDVVTVRDSRADVPVRLRRPGPDEPFAGEERTLSGTGSQVSYSSPDRPAQTCTQAEE